MKGSMTSSKVNTTCYIATFPIFGNLKNGICYSGSAYKGRRSENKLVGRYMQTLVVSQNRMTMGEKRHNMTNSNQAQQTTSYR